MFKVNKCFQTQSNKTWPLTFQLENWHINPTALQLENSHINPTSQTDIYKESHTIEIE